MLIENEDHLRHSFESIVRMYKLCDQIAESPYGHPTTREDEIEGVRAMMRKSREIFSLSTPPTRNIWLFRSRNAMKKRSHSSSRKKQHDRQNRKPEIRTKTEYLAVRPKRSKGRTNSDL